MLASCSFMFAAVTFFFRYSYGSLAHRAVYCSMNVAGFAWHKDFPRGALVVCAGMVAAEMLACFAQNALLATVGAYERVQQGALERVSKAEAVAEQARLSTIRCHAHTFPPNICIPGSSAQIRRMCC